MTKIVDREGNVTKMTYFYDDAGRMVALTDPWGKTYGFAYDEGGLLKRIEYPNRRLWWIV